jgi:ComEC/Rec2-related protein
MSEKIKIWLYKNPAFKMLVLLTLSIIIAHIFSIEFNTLIMLVFVSIIIALFFLKYKNLSYFLAVFFAGIIVSNNINNVRNDLPNKIIQDQNAVFKGEVKRIYSYKKNSSSIIATGVLVMKDLPAIYNTDVFITMINRNKAIPILKAGNEIYCNMTVAFPLNKLLPGEFNEKQFLKSNGIDWRGYTNSNNFAIINNSNNLYYYRDYILSKLNRIIQDNFSINTSSIAFAVISGNKSFIDAQMRENYSYAGTAHLLAVSGLHTGLIAAVIYIILFFIRNQWIKFTFFTISLVLFVFLSGMQPSAVRASAMIILYMWMQLFERPVSPLNIISLVVIFSIIIEPSLVFSAGFQMSVSAVFGIILSYSIFYQKLKKIINIESTIQRYIISSISITLSATLITAPIVAYYFNVFTFSSVLSNLISIPVFVSAVIFLLIGLIFSPIPFDVSKYYFASSDFLFFLNNKIAEFFANIDFLIINDSSSIYFAIAFSLAVIYLFTSNTLKHMIFRGVFTIVVLFFIFPKNINSEFINGIYPRKDIVAIISEDTNSIRVFAIDRKKSEYIRLDYGLAKYLKESNKTIKLGYTGDYGIKLHDNLKYDYDIVAFKLSKYDLKELEKRINLNIPQIIEIK